MIKNDEIKNIFNDLHLFVNKYSKYSTSFDNFHKTTSLKHFLNTIDNIKKDSKYDKVNVHKRNQQMEELQILKKISSRNENTRQLSNSDRYGKIVQVLNKISIEPHENKIKKSKLKAKFLDIPFVPKPKIKKENNVINNEKESINLFHNDIKESYVIFNFFNYFR